MLLILRLSSVIGVIIALFWESQRTTATWVVCPPCHRCHHCRHQLWRQIFCGMSTTSMSTMSTVRIGVIRKTNSVPSLKLTVRTWKWMVWNTTFLLGWPIFRCYKYVSFREGKYSDWFGETDTFRLKAWSLTGIEEPIEYPVEWGCRLISMLDFEPWNPSQFQGSHGNTSLLDGWEESLQTDFE